VFTDETVQVLELQCLSASVRLCVRRLWTWWPSRCQWIWRSMESWHLCFTRAGCWLRWEAPMLLLMQRPACPVYSKSWKAWTTPVQDSSSALRETLFPGDERRRWMTSPNALTLWHWFVWECVLWRLNLMERKWICCELCAHIESIMLMMLLKSFAANFSQYCLGFLLN